MEKVAGRRKDKKTGRKKIHSETGIMKTNPTTSQVETLIMS